MTISSLKPSGYSASFLYNPLAASQTFFLFRRSDDTKPTHNALYASSLSPKSTWRGLWCDNVAIKANLFRKTKQEKQTVKEARPMEEHSQEEWKLIDGTILKNMGNGAAQEAKKRSKLFRKEQLSQGVLSRLMMSLGRLTLEQVRCLPVFCVCIVHPI